MTTSTFSLPRIDKPYEFEGPRGKVRLPDLFDGRRQLIVYHFTRDPDLGSVDWNFASVAALQAAGRLP